MLLAFLFNIGGPEMVVILVVGLLIFGRQLPDVGRKVGQTVAQLRRGMQEFQRQMQEDEDLGEASRSVRELGNELRGVGREAADGIGGAGTTERVGSMARSVKGTVAAARDPVGAVKRLVEEDTAIPPPAAADDGAVDGASADPGPDTGSDPSTPDDPEV